MERNKMAKRCLVFAVNSAKARRYIDSTGRQTKDFIIVTAPESVAGLEPGEYDHITLEGWRENPMIVEAYDAWRVRIYKARAQRIAPA
jgi:hypothetical protein